MALDAQILLLSTVFLLAGIGWPPLHSWSVRRRRARRLREDPRRTLAQSESPVLGPAALITVGLGLLTASMMV